MRSLLLIAFVLVGCGDETKDSVTKAVAAANASKTTAVSADPDANSQTEICPEGYSTETPAKDCQPAPQ